MALITVSDPDKLRALGWGKDGRPLPPYVIADEKLWQQWECDGYCQGADIADIRPAPPRLED